MWPNAFRNVVRHDAGETGLDVICEENVSCNKAILNRSTYDGDE